MKKNKKNSLYSNLKLIILKLTLFRVAIMVLLLANLHFAFGQNSPEFTPEEQLKILEKVDTYRGPQNKSFLMVMEAKSFRNNKLNATRTLNSYVDVVTDPENWRSLVQFLSPANQKGRYLLLSDNAMYYYKKGTRKPIRISPAQRLIGEASNIDVAGVNIRSLYQIESLKADQLGETDTLVFNLIEKKTLAPYHRMMLWVSSKNYFPIKGEFFSKSGKKVKIIYYRKPKKFLGIERPSELVIVNALKKNDITYLTVQDIKFSNLNPSYYKASFLPNIQF